jgi:hypothetical protein
MVSAQLIEERTATEIMTALLGRDCWNVACGGCVGASFQLALGRKVPRARPLRNPKVTEEYRHYEGECGLMVWCSWRLANRKGPLTSSDDESPRRDEGLRGLASRTIVQVGILPSWDMHVEFSGGLMLSVFPDHVGAAASFDGNWEVWTPDLLYAVGTDLVCEVGPREFPNALARPEVTNRPSTRTSATGSRRIKAVRIRNRRAQEPGARRATGVR